MAECNDCPMEPRISALEKADEQHRNTHKEIFGRVNKLETENAVQNAQYSAIIDKLDSLSAKHDKLNAKLEDLESKPAKRWESLIAAIAAALATAFVAWVLNGGAG